MDFSVAVKSGYGDKAETTWAKCTIWGKRGEAVLPYLTKGQLVGISGENTLRKYVKKDGTNDASLEVRVNDVTLLGKRDDSSGDSTREQSPPDAAKPQRAPQAGSFDDFDDDIPF